MLTTFDPKLFKHMRSAWLLFSLLFSSLLSAQSTLLIEDETFKGVKLVVDGYLQNARPTNKLAISNFPEEKVKINILLGVEETITRKLNLPDKGIHRYIVMRNFAGKLQLRYRGKEASVPPEYTKENYNKLLAYASAPSVEPAAKVVKDPPAEEENTEIAAETTTANVPKVEEKPKAKEAAKPAEKIVAATEPAAENKPAIIPAKAERPRITIAQDTPALVKINETFTIEEPKANPKPEGFEALYARLKAEDFEFDKLRVANEKLAKTDLSPEQVVKVLREFRYDQTRFQFLEEAVKHNPALRHSADLFKPEFEYILSRTKVVEILKVNEQ